jgi:hypothetical protein
MQISGAPARVLFQRRHDRGGFNRGDGGQDVRTPLPAIKLAPLAIDVVDDVLDELQLRSTVALRFFSCNMDGDRADVEPCRDQPGDEREHSEESERRRQNRYPADNRGVDEPTGQRRGSRTRPERESASVQVM